MSEIIKKRQKKKLFLKLFYFNLFNFVDLFFFFLLFYFCRIKTFIKIWIRQCFYWDFQKDKISFDKVLLFINSLENEDQKDIFDKELQFLSQVK